MTASGRVVFSKMDEVVFGRPAAEALPELVDRQGASRVFLQVHFASDVLAGFAWGTAWLAVCVLSAQLSRRYWLR